MMALIFLMEETLSQGIPESRIEAEKQANFFFKPRWSLVKFLYSQRDGQSCYIPPSLQLVRK